MRSNLEQIPHTEIILLIFVDCGTHYFYFVENNVPLVSLRKKIIIHN